jgi:4a-hydroxytetrahydrobiopterin dehydratase
MRRASVWRLHIRCYLICKPILVGTARKASGPDQKYTEDAPMAKLEKAEIERRLGTLPGWEFKDDAISKLYRFKEFMDGIKFLNRVAEMAEAADHHPDVKINYTRITFSCSTHDQGGVTEKDFKLAAQIEEAFKAYAA